MKIFSPVIRIGSVGLPVGILARFGRFLTMTVNKQFYDIANVVKHKKITVKEPCCEKEPSLQQVL